MRITADTNILVRAVVRDDPKQYQAVAKLFDEAHLIVIPTSTLCEFVWVLNSRYGFPMSRIADVIDALLLSENVIADGQAAEAGVKMLRSGGDFADGAIAYEGSRMGGETFMSFDRKAIKLLTQQGQRAKLLN